jgi:hypothetical protein
MNDAACLAILLVALASVGGIVMPSTYALRARDRELGRPEHRPGPGEPAAGHLTFHRPGLALPRSEISVQWPARQRQ